MRTDIHFYSEGCRLSGDLYLPEPADQIPAPAIILCHGFAGIKSILLPPYAEAFAAAGFVALVFDYRGFGASEGERGRLVPIEQVRDIRNAITYLQSRDEVDPERIGLWGTSFGGANAITTAAIDTRVRCLAVQITFGSGERMVAGDMDADGRARLETMLAKAWQRAVVRNKPMTLTFEQILTDEDSKAFYQRTITEHPDLATKLPLLTIRESLEYKPEQQLAHIAVPILIIGAGGDIVCPVSESQRLYELAQEPKKLHIIAGARHYDVYEGDYFTESSGLQTEWFSTYLR